MTLTECPSFYATIYVGLRQGYSDEVMSVYKPKKAIQEWADRIGQCVSVTETNFIYTKGSEPGLIIGFINYPRFPVDSDNIRLKALELAEILLETCRQKNLSIVFPDKTIMLSNSERIAEYLKDKK